MFEFLISNKNRIIRSEKQFKRSIIPIIPIVRKPDESWGKTSSKQYLHQIFRSHNLQHEDEITNNSIENIDLTTEYEINYKKTKVKQLIKSIKTNKTSRYDLKNIRIIEETST